MNFSKGPILYRALKELQTVYKTPFLFAERCLFMHELKIRLVGFRFHQSTKTWLPPEPQVWAPANKSRDARADLKSLQERERTRGIHGCRKQGLPNRASSNTTAPIANACKHSLFFTSLATWIITSIKIKLEYQLQNKGLHRSSGRHGGA